MFYKFDKFGWFDGTSEEEVARTTDVDPGEVPSKVVGQPYPNWTGLEWVPAPYVEPVHEAAPPAQVDPKMWWVDVGPFYDRFGPDAPAIAASDHPACKAVRVLTNVRRYINLKDPVVANMIDLLISTSQPEAMPMFPGSGPMTPAKKAAILNTPTTEYERHCKGMSV